MVVLAAQARKLRERLTKKPTETGKRKAKKR
jgi:hypothetical protein